MRSNDIAVKIKVQFCRQSFCVATCSLTDLCSFLTKNVKVIVHLSSFTHPDVILNICGFHLQNKRYFGPGWSH